MTAKPRHCMKCQKTDSGHMVASCPSKQDVCGTCGEAHSLSDCKVTERKNMKCTNCKVAGHPTWDRTCPSFIARLEAHDRKHPENAYKHYPTPDPTTWELLEGGDILNNTGPIAVPAPPPKPNLIG